MERDAASRLLGDALADMGALTTEDAAKGALAALLSAADAESGFDAPMYYVGFANDDFYMIADCTWEVNDCGSIDGWDSSMMNLGYAVNSAVYGNLHDHIYVMNDDGTVGAKLGETDSDYSASGRPWYSQAEGWGEPYDFAGSDIFGSTFTRALAGGDGVVGIDGVGVCHADICDADLSGISGDFEDAMADMGGLTNGNAVKGALAALLSAANAESGFDSPTYFVGFTNDDFYMIKDCTWEENDCGSIDGM